MDAESGPARSLPELANRIPPDPDRSLCRLLEAVAAQLQDVDNTVGSTHERDTAIARLAQFAIMFLSPFPLSVGDDNEKHRCHVSMSILNTLTEAPGIVFEDDVLLAIIPYTDATSATLTDDLIDASSSIISRQLSRRNRTDFIVTALLETAIKPHLSKWSSTRLSAAGRVAAYEDTGARSTPIDLGTSPPWAAQGDTMIPLFQWALEMSDDALLQDHWPSFTPFLLALLDDSSTRSRVQGLRAAEMFILKCPAKVLSERGMGKVLEEAIIPTLQFLPTHTPEDESAQLLKAAYTALVLLANTRFAHDGDLAAKRSLLDRLLREGVFSAYSHASEYVRIVEILATKANSIIDELGIYATKHLKDIIPMFTSAMTDPFLAQHDQSLLAVSEALRSTMLNCWPRALDRYGAEILRGVIVCCLNGREDRPLAEGQALTETLRTIAELVSMGCDASDGYSLSGLSQIIEDKPELQGLFH